MVLELSKFKVPNGREEAVAHAFQNRHRVEQMESVLGTKVFTDKGDPSVFNLSSRWSTESAFGQGHSSGSHRTSHQGVPKGFNLDPAFAGLLILQHLCS
jgi:heme-degrading monooxygenase HmoA